MLYFLALSLFKYSATFILLVLTSLNFMELGISRISIPDWFWGNGIYNLKGFIPSYHSTNSRPELRLTTTL